MFETPPINQEIPTSVPRAAAPTPLPVAAHLVWPDGRDEWVPALATRWTRTHVLVEVPARASMVCWLSAVDVRRGGST